MPVSGAGLTVLGGLSWDRLEGGSWPTQRRAPAPTGQTASQGPKGGAAASKAVPRAVAGLSSSAGWVGLDRPYRWVRGCSSAGREPGLLGWVGQRVGVLQGATGRSERVHLGCDLG